MFELSTYDPTNMLSPIVNPLTGVNTFVLPETVYTYESCFNP